MRPQLSLPRLIGMCVLLSVFGYSSAQGPVKADDKEKTPLKVLVIGRSEFGSGGSLGNAIQSWGKADGTAIAEVDQGKEFGYGDFIKYKSILKRKLASEKFDFVFLSMHNDRWDVAKPEDLYEAAADCHEIITKSGAKTALYMLFVGPKSQSADKLMPHYQKAYQAMIDRQIDGKKRDVLLIPAMLLSEAKRDQEPENAKGGRPRPRTGWEQGGIHPTEVGQYAYGCLSYVFMTGKDPHKIDCKSPADAKEAKWIQDTVWTLYEKRDKLFDKGTEGKK
jgi:hypothetical protein